MTFSERDVQRVWAKVAAKYGEDAAQVGMAVALEHYQYGGLDGLEDLAYAAAKRYRQREMQSERRLGHVRQALLALPQSELPSQLVRLEALETARKLGLDKLAREFLTEQPGSANPAARKRRQMLRIKIRRALSALSLTPIVFTGQAWADNDPFCEFFKQEVERAFAEHKSPAVYCAEGVNDQDIQKCLDYFETLPLEGATEDVWRERLCPAAKAEK